MVKYKAVYQFRWVIMLAFIALIYISNLVLVKLPFVSIQFPKFSLEKELIASLLCLAPDFDIEFHIYSLQTIVVWMSGIVLGPKTSALTISIYLLLGFLGLPVFAGGGGIDYYSEPTFGYLISFPANGFLSGWFYKENKKLLAVFIPIFTTHILGILYLVLFKGSWLNIGWHLSFSMISYDLIFAFVLIPILPFICFILREMVIQEVPTRSLFSSEHAYIYKTPKETKDL